MTNQEIYNWAIANLKLLKETAFFIIIFAFATMIKIIKMTKLGSKVTVSFVFTEIVMSVLVGLSVYALFDQFLNCHELLTYVICAWCSSFSTIFHTRVEKLLNLAFDFVEKIFVTKTPEI